MKRLILPLFLTTAFQLLGQTELTVVNGTTSDVSNQPAVMSESWEFSLHQHIYKQSLINQSGSITKIAFEHVGEGFANTNCKIYMAETTKSSFTGGSDWVNSGLTEVFDGTMTTLTDNWYEITLNTPFNYTNTNNLLIVIDRKTGSSPGTGRTHKQDAADANVTLRVRGSSSHGNVGSWSTFGTRYSILPNLKLTFGSGGGGNCSAPAVQATFNGNGNASYCLDEVGTLSANATAGENCSGNWEYAWYTGTGTDNSYWNGTTWDNAETWGSFANISSVEITNNITYKVKVRCSNETTCSNDDATGVTLTLIEATTINAQPQNATVCPEDDVAQFTVSATQATSYQWEQFDGSSWQTITDGGIFSGSSTATLTITNAGLSMHTTLLRAVVSGTCNEVVTSDATLFVDAEACDNTNPASFEEQVSPSISFSVFPNPASEYVSIKLNGATHKTVQLTLIDLTGKHIQQQSIAASNQSVTAKFMLTHLESGMYFIQVSAQGMDVRTIKVIKR
jgi:hypothetical protein